MKKINLLLTLCLSLHSLAQNTPDIKSNIHNYIDTLTAPAMHGRGYVQHGQEQAAAYIQAKFREFGLQPVIGPGQYTQGYTFPVNTFPGKMALQINGKTLAAGDDYIIDAGSSSFTGADLPIVTIDMTAHIAGMRELISTFDLHHAYLLQNVDSFCKLFKIHQEEIVSLLRPGCYIIPQKNKLTWTVERLQMGATVFYVKAASLPDNINTVSASVDAVEIKDSRNDNIIGMVPGKVKDSFIVLSAHYDHLGMMGNAAYFPGASDNASGTAMLLYLASWFAVHPQRYSILFIAFSGEEAGLLGSAYFVAHPVVSLSHMKFLANIDIMGDATDGVTVVNATEFPRQFQLLNKINDTGKYIPIIKSRGKAANSDHYHFTEKGVPSFFIYSNGGKGFYHDIFDVSKEITLNHVDGVARLLTEFINRLN